MVVDSHWEDTKLSSIPGKGGGGGGGGGGGPTACTSLALCSDDVETCMHIVNKECPLIL